MRVRISVRTRVAATGRVSRKLRGRRSGHVGGGGGSGTGDDGDHASRAAAAQPTRVQGHGGRVLVEEVPGLRPAHFLLARLPVGGQAP